MTLLSRGGRRISMYRNKSEFSADDLSKTGRVETILRHIFLFWSGLFWCRDIRDICEVT